MRHLVIGPTSLQKVFDSMMHGFPCGLAREASNVVVDGSSLVGSKVK